MVDKIKKSLVDSGIVRRADLTLELDHGKIADALREKTESTLRLIPAVSLHEDHDIITKHTSVVTIHHDKMAEGLAQLLGVFLEHAKEQIKGDASQFSYKVMAHDDGTKIQVKADIDTLNTLINQMQSLNVKVDGILNHGDIPENKEQLQKKAEELFGVDMESKEFIFDGQTFLQIMQAYINDAHKRNANDTEDSIKESRYQTLEKFMKAFPGSKLERNGNHVALELDMKELIAFMKKRADEGIAKVNGIELVHPESQDPFTTTLKIDYKILTRQAMKVAADMLKNKAGMRVAPGDDATIATFNTDLMKADSLVADLRNTVNGNVAELGAAIAAQATGAKPDGFIASVVKHFGRGNDGHQKGA